MEHFPTIIVGAGAAGLFCASRINGDVLILEAGARPGRKLSASGGGRANFTNRHISTRDYLCRPEPDFPVNALAAFTSRDILEMIQAWGLPWEEREHGRIFLRCPASRLASRLRERSGQILTASRVKRISPHDGFIIQAGSGAFHCDALVLALGSPACPKLAQVEDPWAIAQELGHTVNPPVPALAPLFYTAEESFRELAGIGVFCRLRLLDAICGGDLVWEDDLLFTHKGLSGPAALQASLFWSDKSEVEIDFLPGENFERILDENESLATKTILCRRLPNRLAHALLPQEWSGEKVARLSRKIRKQIGALVNARRFSHLKAGGLPFAEVARGGVAVSEVDPATMESRKIKGLYLVGEMLDVTGRLGGYNLHWAFASAFCAARAIERQMR